MMRWPKMVCFFTLLSPVFALAGEPPMDEDGRARLRAVLAAFDLVS